MKWVACIWMSVLGGIFGTKDNLFAQNEEVIFPKQAFLPNGFCFREYYPCQSIPDLPIGFINAKTLAPPCFDTLSRQKMQRILNPTAKKFYDYPYYFWLHYDFYTTVMASFAKNPVDPNTEHSNIYFYYNVTLNNRLQLKSFRVNTYFFNEFGKRFFMDSISALDADKYYLKNTFSKALIKDKFSLSTMLNIQSQFWRHYDYREDGKGQRRRYLTNNYFTPGYILFSAGFTYDFWKGSSITLGLASGKITKLRDASIWDSRPADVLYGVEAGHKIKTIYGINLQVNILPKKIGKQFVWVNNSELYLPNEHLGSIKYYTLHFNNALHYLFLQYFRVSLRTQIKYDLAIQEKPEILNQVSIGFYLSNVIK